MILIAKSRSSRNRSTYQVNTTSSRPKLVVTAHGTGVVSHAGARLLADLAEVTGLERALSTALAPMRQRVGGHDPGRVAVDVAVMLAGGGEAISDLAVLRDQPELFGQVASPATAWRVLDGIDADALAWIGRREHKPARLPGPSALTRSATSRRPRPPGGTSPAW